MCDEQSITLMLSKGEEVEVATTEEPNDVRKKETQRKQYPAARVLLLRILQVVVGMCLLVLSGVAGLDGSIDVLVVGCTTSALVIAAAALSIRQSRGFGGYWNKDLANSRTAVVSTTQGYASVVAAPTVYVLREHPPCKYRALKAFQCVLWVVGYAVGVILCVFALDLCLRPSTETQCIVGALHILLIITNSLCGITIGIIDCRNYPNLE